MGNYLRNCRKIKWTDCAGFFSPGKAQNVGEPEGSARLCNAARREKDKQGVRVIFRQFLIVVDMQKDFVDGALGSKEAAAIVPAVVEKIWGFDGEVLFTYDTHGADYLRTREGRKLPVPHCIEGTEGWRLYGELEDLRFKIGGKAFTKTTFGSRELAAYLMLENEKKPIERVELVGLCTDICVIANALLLQAFLPETEIAVDAACCAGVTPESHARAIEAMRACQIEVL